MKKLSAFLLFAFLVLGYQPFVNASPVSSSIGGAYLVFADKMGGEISPKTIRTQCELAVAGCAKGSKIFTFTLVITKSGKRTTMKTNSNELTAAMRDLLQSLSTGDSFEFKRIEAYLPNGKDKVDVFAKPFRVV